MAAAVSNPVKGDILLRFDQDYKTIDDVFASKVSRSKASSSRSASHKANEGSSTEHLLVKLINRKRFDAASTLLGDMIHRGEDVAKSFPSTILITAVNMVSPVPFLKELIRAIPDCIRKRDKRGKSALHAAVRCHHSAASMLIEQFPEALSAKSQKGLLPIHYACRHRAPVHVIDCMVQYQPTSLSDLTKLGWTPLHMAIAHHAPDDTILRLCSSEALRIKTGDGARLPLHIAAVMGCTTKVATRVLSQYPEGSQVRDAYGKTALDYVIDYKRWELSKLFFLTDSNTAPVVVKKRHRTYTVSREDSSSKFPNGRPTGGAARIKRTRRHRISSVSF